MFAICWGLNTKCPGIGQCNHEKATPCDPSQQLGQDYACVEQTRESPKHHQYLAIVFLYLVERRDPLFIGNVDVEARLLMIEFDSFSQAWDL